MSVTKNPLIIDAASYICNWFQSRVKTQEELEMMNIIEDTKSDATYLKYLKQQENKKSYEDLDNRMKNLEAKYDKLSKS